MSVHFILDGYNVIKRTPSLAEGSLQEGRDRLFRLLATRRPQGSLRNRVTVIFDGRSGVTSPVPMTFVRVIFTREESADEKIKRIVCQAENKRNIIVVTDDREIQYHVRALGAGVRCVGDFFHPIAEPGKQVAGKPSGHRHRDGKGISRVLEEKITSELRDVWLKKE